MLNKYFLNLALYLNPIVLEIGNDHANLDVCWIQLWNVLREFAHFFLFYAVKSVKFQTYHKRIHNICLCPWSALRVEWTENWNYSRYENVLQIYYVIIFFSIFLFFFNSVELFVGIPYYFCLDYFFNTLLHKQCIVNEIDLSPTLHKIQWKSGWLISFQKQSSLWINILNRNGKIVIQKSRPDSPDLIQKKNDLREYILCYSLKNALRHRHECIYVEKLI